MVLAHIAANSCCKQTWVHCLITSENFSDFYLVAHLVGAFLLETENRLSLQAFPTTCWIPKNKQKKNQRHENIGPFLLCCLDQRSLTSDAALRYGVLNWHGISLLWMPGRVNRAQMPYVTPKEASVIQTARRYTEVKPCINSSYKKPWNNLNLLSLTQLIPSQC